MEILPNTPLSSLFDTSPANANTAVSGKDDMFSKMMGRLLADAAERRLDQQRAVTPPKPKLIQERPDKPAPPPRAPETAETARAGAPEPARKAEDSQDRDRVEQQQADKTQVPGKDKPAAKSATTDGVAKKDATKATKAGATGETARSEDAAESDEAVPAEAAATDEADPAGLAGAMDDEVLQDKADDDAPADAAVVVIEAQVTITETTVTLVTESGSQAVSLTNVTATLGAEATELTATADDAAVMPVAATDGAVPLIAPAPGAIPAPGALLGAPPTGDAIDAAMLPGHPAAEQAQGTAAAKESGSVALDGLPEIREELPATDRFAELMASARNGRQDGGSSREGEAGDRSGADRAAQQPAAADAGAAPVQPLQPTPADTLKQLLSAKPPEVVAAPEAAPKSGDPVAGHESLLAAVDGPRAAHSTEATMTAALRPSRGTAGMPHAVPEQVAVHIQKNVKEGNDQFTINLRPDEMGRIDIRLEIATDGRVSAIVAVEKAQTLELLQRDSRNLERALQDAGLQTDSNSLSFSLRGEGNPFQGEGQRGGGQGRRGRGFGGGDDPVEASAAYNVTLGPGRVDIRA